MRKDDSQLQTIDGVDSPPREPPLPATTPAPVPGLHDYPELVTVERRHYAISHEIAKGGMGRVLEARDLRLGRAVAIKELLPRNRDAARRFEREARITARLQHPAIIHVYEAGVWVGGEPFYAMTMVSGRSLDKVVAERPTLVERLGLVPNVIAVADALAYAHNEGVIHRDLKPANVLVGAFGETVVIDWGLAKDLGAPVDPKESLQLRTRGGPEETNAGSIVGTPAYMPPEQARGESVDQRADVYSLGALLYHVLVGTPPFSGTSSSEVLELVKTKACVPVRDREPGAPADLVAIVSKAMQRDRIERYADADELAHDLKRFQTGQLVAAHNYTTRQLFWRWVRKHRVPVAITVIAAVTLVALATVFINRIVDAQHKDAQRRKTLLEERGRSELNDGQFGRALAYLVPPMRDGEVGGALGFLIADAMRPFEAEVAKLTSDGTGDRAIAYSSDGRQVATIVENDAIRISDWTGHVEATFGETPAQMVLFDPSHARVAVVSNTDVRLWTTTGTLQRTLVGHEGATITDAEFSPDGNSLVTASVDGTARLWNLTTGDSLPTGCDGNQPLVLARFSPNGERIVFAVDDRTTYMLCMWDTRTQKDAPMRGHKGRVNTVRWSPDGKLVLTASEDGTVRLWDPLLGKGVIAPIQHESGGISSAELSSDGRRILTAGADRTARVWEIPDYKDNPTVQAKELLKLGSPGAAHGDVVESAVFGAEDALIATAGRDNKAKVWDARTGRLIATFEHALAIDTIAFTDSTHVLTGSRDHTARIWDVTRSAQLRVYDTDAVVHSLAIAPNGTLVAARDELIEVWPATPNATLPAQSATPQFLHGHTGLVYALALSPDGAQLVSAGEDDQALIWDLATGKQVGVIALKRTLEGSPSEHIRAVAFSPDGQTIATAATLDGTVRLWSRDGKPLRTLADGKIAVQSLAYSPDGTTLVGVGDDGFVAIWRAGEDTPRRTKHTTSLGRTVAFRRDGKVLAVAGAHDTKLFSFEHGEVGKQLVSVDTPTGDVTAVAFTHDGSRVVTASSDGATRLWDAAKGKLVGTRDARGGPITSIALTPDGNAVWVGSEDHSVRAWDIHVESRSADWLEQFVKQHIPWRLDNDDNVTAETEGDSDGKR